MEPPRVVHLARRVQGECCVDGWVWLDYISMDPQVIGCAKNEVASVLADQKAAIQAIPSYVRHAQHFWICAPSGSAARRHVPEVQLRHVA